MGGMQQYLEAIHRPNNMEELHILYRFVIVYAIILTQVSR